MGKMVEVDSDVLEQLNMAYNLQKNLFDSDESRADYEAALKKKFPDKYKTSREVADTYLKPVKDELEDLKKWKKEKQEAEADLALNEKFNELRKSGFTEEGIEEVKKIMVDRKVADPDVAAAYFEKRNPPKAIESTGYGERGWNFTDNADEKGTEANDWFKDPNRMFDKIANEEFSKKRKTA